MQIRGVNGVIHIQGDRTVPSSTDSTVVDLPDTILLPGFVNAHCHIDLSHLAGQFDYKGSFSGWIRDVMSRRLAPDPDAMFAAAQALLQSGVTTVYDHVGPWSDLSSVLDLPLRYRFFVEVSGVTRETAKERLGLAQDLAIRLKREGYRATPTPHAPYSLHADIFQKIIQSSPRPSPPRATDPGSRGPEGTGCRIKSGMTTEMLSMHYAESAEEQEYFETGAGKMAAFLSELGSPPPKVRGRKAPSGPRPYTGGRGELFTRIHTPWLAIHCNTVSDSEIAMLKATNATVVHCPRSHRYFNHPPFPLEKLRAAGIPIAIGTDSLASCPNFDFLAELRAMREEFPFLTTDEILKMATGRESLVPNDTDDIIGLPLQDDILKGPVTFSMIGGQRVI